MTHLDYIELNINGYLLKENAIVEYCQKQHDTKWNRTAYFMIDWLDSNSKIKLQTSGSTGVPKTIEVQKIQLLQSAAATAKYFNFSEGEVGGFSITDKIYCRKNDGSTCIVQQVAFKKVIEPTSHPFEFISDEEK